MIEFVWILAIGIWLICLWFDVLVPLGDKIEDQRKRAQQAQGWRKLFKAIAP